MKRILLFAAAFLFMSVMADAAPITSRQAEKNLKEFLYGNSRMKYSAGPVTIATSGESIQPYYIFNLSNNGGFVIMSGDDAAYPVLGYSTNGSFDSSNVPENMQAWLNGYAEKLRQIQKMNLPAQPAISEALTGHAAIPALLKCTWGQGFPFNYECPKFGDSSPRPTGCAATSMAQVMYYHKWPARPTNTIPGYSYQDEDGSIRKMEALSPIDFKWDMMKDNYSGGFVSEEDRRAVAELMKYAGYSLEMQYGTKGSSAYPSALPTALINYFGYDSSLQIIQRQNYRTQNEWEEVMYNELSNGRPILYNGVTKNMEGHAFVCDGYDGNGLFHINWGWEGQSNGFYRLDVLDPKHQGTGGSDMGLAFSEYQSAVIGIQKAGEETVSANLSVGDITADAGSSFNFNVNLNNTPNNCTGLQFDIKLPKGIAIKNNSNGTPLVNIYGNRTSSDHKINVTQLSTGSYRINLSSPSHASFKGTSGALLRITLQSDANMESGNYNSSISNATITDNKLQTKAISGVTFKIKINAQAKPVEKDRISAGSFKAEAGKSSDINVALKNAKENYISMQFDLHLPQGITIKNSKDNKPSAALNMQRFTKDHKVSVNHLQNGDYRFVIYSTNNAIIKGTQGNLLSITAEAANDMKPGIYAGSISSITMCSSDMQSYDIDGCSFNIEITAPAKPVEKDCLIADDINVEQGGTADFSIELINSKADYVSMQFDLQLPEGVTIATSDDGRPMVNMAAERFGSSHRASISKLSESVYRFVIYSTDNSPIKGNKGALMSITAEASKSVQAGSHTAIINNITVCNSALQDTDLENAVFNIIVDKYTGINDAQAESIDNAVIYNMSGMRINKDASSLPKGIYIINGKKIVIR